MCNPCHIVATENMLVNWSVEEMRPAFTHRHSARLHVPKKNETLFVSCEAHRWVCHRKRWVDCGRWCKQRFQESAKYVQRYLLNLFKGIY